ncbi:MAG: iron-sulfur cluster assembly accessory protein [Legionellales bacterium]|nr:iron-sulfur cluster assembly accessory protein [Legionellales bacterium]
MSGVVQHVRATDLADVTLSEAAICHVLAYLGKQGLGKGIRLSVKRTGCSGLSYVVDYVDAASDNDMVLPYQECLVCIDKASYPSLKGVHVDYVKQGLNHKFVFQNPNQTGLCGCGESFTISE